ncbi:unnamed protein product [Phytophthora fragariaefolia]|uniref:Unnamed protein product n=1 Tax=Phytophthora fragariaefolia TaxID=1490495 RepID=A0A9W6WWE2_9STRA|nr:unnamed protein product [Phytophthora fragariaefolia]
MKALGDTHYILGMEIDYNRAKGELCLCQTQYITCMLERFGQMESFAARNPNVVGQDLRPQADAAPLSSTKPYRKLVASLLYVANCTRPDISVSIGMLSQYLDKAQDLHWHATILVLRYLKCTPKMALVFKLGPSKNVAVAAFGDANWGGDIAARRSTSGVLVLMDGARVIFKSKRQSSVALSAAEAEYMALALTTQELEWLHLLLDEIDMQVARPMLIKVENQVAISIAHYCGYTPRANTSI